MILLSTDLSDPLLTLLPHHPALVDAVEVGPWFSPDQITEYRRLLPEMPFYFHGADLLARVGLDPQAIPRITAYLDATSSPWVSMHLGLWPPEALARMHRSGLPLPLPDPDQAAKRLAGQVRLLAQSISVPLLLENVEPLPLPGCEFEVQPGVIAQLIETTGCGFLLDTGHARIAASALGISVAQYLSGLPMDRVEQVHVSGPRWRDDRLCDAHEPLQGEDYDLLELILAQAEPRLVTLEYIREPAALYEQLTCLRQLIK